MKKFLLMTAVVSSALFMNAEIKTVTYHFATNDYGLTRQTDNAGEYIESGTKLTVNDGTQITLTKTEGKNGWRLWSDGLRIYKNSDAEMTITTSVGAITKIEFSTKASILKSVSGVTVSESKFALKCDGNSIPLKFDVNSNGAIYTLTLTVDTEGTGTSTAVSAADSEPTPPPTVTTVKSIAETLAVKDGETIKVDYPMTVAFRNNNNVFAYDAAGDFIQLFGKNSYEVNDVVPAGWEGVYSLYNGATPEIAPVTEFPAADGDNVFKPSVVSASEIDASLVNHVFAIKDVVFSEATPSAKENFEGTSDGVTLTFRNNYTLESQPAGKYNVTVVVNVYKGAVQLYVINYTADVTGSGISEVEVANGAAAYYTLQGVKVANPENGLYIKVQNGKASKILVK